MSSALASQSGIAACGRSLIGIALLALLLPVFGIRAWSSAYADRLGNTIAASLLAVVPTLPPPQSDEVWLGQPDEQASFERASSLPSASLGAKRPPQAVRPRSAPLHGIRISSAQVLALASRRAMPNAVFVKATAQRPAGLLLSGVAALGVGLQDGDVLTEAAGQKASSLAVVVGVVLAARARKATEISGRFYRGSVPFSLTVEQPYPKGPVPG